MYIYIYVGMCVLLAAWSAYAIAEAPMARRSSIGRGDTARAVANRRSRVCTSTHAVDPAGGHDANRCVRARVQVRAATASGAGAADGAGGFTPRECAQPTPTRSDPIRSVPTRLDSTRSLVGAGGFCLALALALALAPKTRIGFRKRTFPIGRHSTTECSLVPSGQPRRTAE